MDDKWEMSDKLEWSIATKITLILVVIGIIFGVILTLLMKYFKGNL